MNFDVVVVGASTAGLFAAELLAKNGKRVALFETSDPIDPDSRLYIITPGLYRVVPDLDPALIRHKIGKIQIQSGTASKEIQLTSQDLVIDRRDLLFNLLTRAEKAGVELFRGSQFIGFEEDRDNGSIAIDIQGDKKIITTNYLIAADGLQSSVRKSISALQIKSAPLLQAEIDLPANWDDTITTVWFDPELTQFFYWLIPDRDRKAVVGLIGNSGSNIRKDLETFIDQFGFEVKGFQAGQVAMHFSGIDRVKKISGTQVFFIGESAGQVKVTTVGGTVTGLAGAKAAAEAILEGTSYQNKLRELQRELDLHLLIRKLLNQMNPEDYMRLINFLNPPIQKMLSTYDRDQMRTHFWKLAFLQPALIPIGLKLLLRLGFG